MIITAMYIYGVSQGIGVFNWESLFVCFVADLLLMEVVGELRKNS